MDPSGVLLALEEQKKWRERRHRIEERIKQLGRRKAYLERELERTRKKVSDYNAMLAGLKGPLLRDRAISPPANR
ncbi:MAG TPA: hypothetical protein VI999_06665 [Thermoplasmata archaeon]|nr:hypothetical protein [Thermoplasmata archaeon]